MTISSRQRELAQYLWREGRLSRSDLCQRMGLSANSIGTLSAELIARGVICECEPEPSRGGRPRVPLEIDPTRCNAVGLSIDPGQISAVRVNLCGHRLGKTILKEVDTPSRMLTPIAGLLKQTVNEQTLGVGLSVTGFVDPASLCILQSSAAPAEGSVSLAAVRELVAPRPVIIENDMHAMAARWLLTHRADAGEDVLVVYIADGELGAALIVGGRPNRGCVTGGNELGHMRLPVETARCYCGHTGCLERISSSDFLLRHGAEPGATLRDSAARFDGDDPSIEALVTYLATGIANACNFVRPHRLVLVSELTRYPIFCDHLVRGVRRLLLAALVDRVRVDYWDQPLAHSAETAGWLAIASLFWDGWQPAELSPVQAAG